MNVLFLMADELSWWGLGHVDPRIHTPNIDRLAKRSVRFKAAYTPSPICVPTRAAIACGRYLNEIGYWSSAEPYEGSVLSWGHALQQAGYEPVSIGKLHYRSVEDDTGFSRQIEPIHVVDGIGWIQALLRRPVAPFNMTHTLARDIGPGDSGYIQYDGRVTDAAVNWLAEPDRQSAPWCAFVSWLAPHFPLISPPETYELYDPATFESGPETTPDHPILREITDYFNHDSFFDVKTRGIAKASYFGLCSFLDQQVGRVLDALEETGLADDTLVIFTSDHGEMLGEKGFWTKSTMYDSAAKVPLLLAGPNIEPGDWNAPVSLIDIAPTICNAMAVDGTSFPGVDLRMPDAERVVLSEYHDGGATVGFTMVRWDKWKLVYYAEGHESQLFNLDADPREEDDLAKSEPDLLREGFHRLHAMMDPEQVNRRALADQARRVVELGGRDAILSKPTFDYTPADSR